MTLLQAVREFLKACDDPKEQCPLMTERQTARLKTVREIAAGEHEKRGNGQPTSWPAGFELTKDMREFAIGKGVEPEAEFAAFRDWALANGRTYIDWEAAWRTRINNAPRFASKNGQPAHVLPKLQAPSAEQDCPVCGEKGHSWIQCGRQPSPDERHKNKAILRDIIAKIGG